MIAQSGRASENGFTLLELLVSLAILSLIASGLVLSMNTSTDIWLRSKTVQSIETPLKVRTNLRYWIEAAAPKTRNFPYDTSFIGSETKFTFLSMSKPFDPLGYAMRITVDAESNHLSLHVVSVDEYDKEVSNRSFELARSEGGYRFEYFKGDYSTGEWSAAWETPSLLPELIKITSVNPSDNWPEFVVAPLLK